VLGSGGLLQDLCERGRKGDGARVHEPKLPTFPVDDPVAAHLFVPNRTTDRNEDRAISWAGTITGGSICHS